MEAARLKSCPDIEKGKPGAMQPHGKGLGWRAKGAEHEQIFCNRELLFSKESFRW